MSYNPLTLNFCILMLLVLLIQVFPTTHSASQFVERIIPLEQLRLDHDHIFSLVLLSAIICCILWSLDMRPTILTLWFVMWTGIGLDMIVSCVFSRLNAQIMIVEKKFWHFY